MNEEKTFFGFWMYLMSDLVLFAGLFATFAVLHNTGFGTGFFNAPFVLLETLILLTSSFTCGLALLAARANKKSFVIFSLCATGILGALFLFLEISEFAKLIAAGNGPQQNGALSSYFTLVGTHGLHVFAGLLWMVALIISIAMRGLSSGNMRKLSLLALFWHFLDIVWIFIFTIVYMMGIL